MPCSALSLPLLLLASESASIVNLQLLWSAPQSCPDTAQVRAHVDALLGKSAEAALSRPLHVTATVQQQGEDRFTLEITWHDHSGGSSRSILADSCVDLARAAALTTALVIDPSAPLSVLGQGATPGTPSSQEQIVEPPQKTVKPTSKQARLPPVERTETTVAPTPIVRHTDVFVTGVTGIGVLPGVAFGAAIGLEHYWGTFLLRGGFGMYLPKDWSKENYTGSLWPAELALDSCYSVGTRRFDISPCVGAQLQRYWARARNAERDEDKSSNAWSLRGGVGLEGRYWASPTLAVVASGWILLAPSRPAFRLRPETLVFAPELASFRLTLGAAYDLF